MSVALQVVGLAAGYGSARVVTDVNLEVASGEIIGIAGRNGAGKTTVLRAISGLIPRTAGALTLHGVPLPARADLVARMGVAHVPEGRGIFRTLSARANLKFGMVACGHRFDEGKLAEVLTFFPRLERLLDRPAGLLSGGEQQMLAIARGMIAEPRLLMVDELSLGLAPKATWDVMRAVAEMCRKAATSLLLVDQNVRALAQTCDRLYLLDGGTAHHLGDPHEADQTAWGRLYF
jgi:branched-chain amino acid transport system ATP-binding protein